MIYSYLPSEFVLNPAGKSDICILHEYVQHAMRVQPRYIIKELGRATPCNLYKFILYTPQTNNREAGNLMRSSPSKLSEYDTFCVGFMHKVSYSSYNETESVNAYEYT